MPRAAHHPPPTRQGSPLTAQQWGMVSFLASEVALFGTLIVTYLFYLGKEVVGPTPAEALSLRVVVFTTGWLLARSGTIHFSGRGLDQGTPSRIIQFWAGCI